MAVGPVASFIERPSNGYGKHAEAFARRYTSAIVIRASAPLALRGGQSPISAALRKLRRRDAKFRRRAACVCLLHGAVISANRRGLSALRDAGQNLRAR